MCFSGLTKAQQPTASQLLHSNKFENVCKSTSLVPFAALWCPSCPSSVHVISQSGVLVTHYDVLVVLSGVCVLPSHVCVS